VSDRIEALIRARRENPALTVFDTGEMHEPEPGEGGVVTFTNSEGAPVLDLSVHPGFLESDDEFVTVIEIDWAGPGTLRINLNDWHVATFSEQGRQLS
jgi:hypothetical protein